MMKAAKKILAERNAERATFADRHRHAELSYGLDKEKAGGVH